MKLYFETNNHDRHIAIDTKNKCFTFNKMTDKAIIVTAEEYEKITKDVMTENYQCNWYM